eukprot:scaffold1307_cov166-Ochromonas_danica.AAC.37
MLKKLGEKDDTTELLLAELREENQALMDRLASTQRMLMEKEHAYSEMEQRCEDLEETVEEVRRQGHASVNDLSEDNDKLLEELNQLRDLLAQRTALFEERLSSIEKERNDLAIALTTERSQASNHYLETENHRTQLMTRNAELSQVMDMIQVIYPTFLRGIEEVEHQLEGRLIELDARLDQNADLIYEVNDAMLHHPIQANGYPSHGGGEDSNSDGGDNEPSTIPISRRLLQKTLRETQFALQDALQRHENDEEHIIHLSDEIQRIQEEKQNQLMTIQDLEHQLLSLRNANKKVSSNISAVEVSDLKARLCAVEGRAEKAAAEHAKHYAQHVRVIAYLESECSRLRGLGDHFRGVNVKLMNDLKKVKLEALKCRGLEHRVTILVENEKSLQSKLQQIEKSLIDKNEEIIHLIREKEAEEMEKLRKYEEEISECHEQIGQLSRQLQDASKNYDQLVEKQRLVEHEAKVEIHQLKLQIDHLEHDNTLQLRHSEELDFELKAAREELRQRDLLLSQNEMKLGLLTQESTTSIENYERMVKELSAELEEKLGKIQTLDQAVVTMRTKMVDMEASLLTRDEELTTKLIQRGDLEAELHSLRDALQQKTADCIEFQQSNGMLTAEVSTLSTQLQSLETRYQELTEVNLKQANERAMKSEASVRQLTEELQSAKSQLETQDDLLSSARASLNEVEASLHSLQVEYVDLQTTEQVLRASNEALTEESDLLRNQVQELAMQLTTTSQKARTAESELNVNLDLIQDLRHEIMLLEKKEQDLRSQLLYVESSEAHHLEELEDVVALLAPIEDVYDHSHGVVSTTIAVAGGTSSGGVDMFASPLAVATTSVDRESVLSNKLTQLSASLKSRAGMCMSTLTSLQEKIRDQANALQSITQQAEGYKNKLDKTDYERQETQHVLKNHEKQVNELQTQVTSMEETIHSMEEMLTKKQQHIREMVISSSETMQQLCNKLMNELEPHRLVEAHLVISEFKEIANLLVLREDLCSASAMVVHGEAVDSLEHYLTIFYSKVDNVLLFFGQFIENVAEEKQELMQSMESLKQSLESDQQNHQLELDAHKAKAKELQDEVDRLFQQLAEVSNEVEGSSSEIIGLKQNNKDLAYRANELEIELKDTFAVNQDLSESLKEAKSIQEELQQELKGLHGELDRKDQSLKTLQDQLAMIRKRSGESDLQFEKMSTAIQSLRAEKEALENVRQSLEGELDRSRQEYLAIMGKYHPMSEEDKGYGFELEKLLAALTSTTDQIEENFGGPLMSLGGGAGDVSGLDLVVIDNSSAALDTSASSSKKLIASNGNVSQDRYQDIQKRVEQAVNRLSRIRTRSREEARHRKLLEKQQIASSEEIRALTEQLEDAQRQLHHNQKDLLEMNAVIDEKDHELKNIKHDFNRLQNDEMTLSQKVMEMESLVEQLKKENIRLVEELQVKGSELTRLTRSMESTENTLSKLQSELNTIKLDQQQAILEAEQRSQQLKLATENHQKALQALEQVEHALQRERQARDELDHKLHQLEGESGTFSHTRMLSLTSDYEKLKEENRSLQHLKFVHEDRINSLEQELESRSQQITSLEHRIDLVLKERSSIADEVAETKRKIQAAKESYEFEKSLRLRSEAAMDALKKAQGEDMRKIGLEGLVTIRNNETESVYLLAEEEKRSLRAKIQELKLVVDEKEMLRQHEISDKKRMEKEIEQLQGLLAKRSNEVVQNSTLSTVLRKEGRLARKEVTEAAAKIAALVNSLSLDLQLGFTATAEGHSGNHSMLASATTAFDLKIEVSESGAGGATTTSLKLVESLGLPNLHDIVEKLETLFRRYQADHNEMKSRLQDHSTSQKDVISLRQQLQTLVEQRTQLVNQHLEEKKVLQTQLLRLKNEDGGSERLLSQIASLEASLKKEKDRKERALTELNQLRHEVDRMKGSNMAVEERHNVLGDEALALQGEVNRLSVENRTLRQELERVHAHRAALKDTVDQLDRRLRQSSDPASPGPAPHAPASVSSYRDQTERNRRAEGGDMAAAQQSWAVTRYQARARAMEELANLYRQSLQALSPEGPPAKLEAYEALDNGASSSIYLKLAVHWIDDEVTTIRNSYEEEIRCLDSQVQDLYSKLKEHQAYEMEMRKQMEDFTKSFYRMTKDTITVPPELHQLRRDLQRTHSELYLLQEEMMKEKKHSRLRHVHLVEDLTKALEAREVALLALRRLEKHCAERRIDISDYAHVEDLFREVVRSSAAEQVLDGPAPYSPGVHHSPGGGYLNRSQQPQQTGMTSLIRGVIDADHDLQEAERRHQNRLRRKGSSAASNLLTNAENNLPGSATKNRPPSANSTRSGTGLSQLVSATVHSTPDGRKRSAGPPEEEQVVRPPQPVSVENALTETFLTNRIQTVHQTTTESSQVATSSAVVTSSTSTSVGGNRQREKSQIPGYQGRGSTGSYNLPTAANSSGGSFLRVAKNNPSTK